MIGLTRDGSAVRKIGHRHRVLLELSDVKPVLSILESPCVPSRHVTRYQSNMTNIAILLLQAFHKAGLPPGVINLVTGKGSEIGDYLTTHPSVNCIR